MRVYHNTREAAFRTPYGAVAAGEAVELALDIAGAHDVVVHLRTWVDGVGEARYEMEAVKPATDDGSCVRYRVEYVPKAPGIVWYQFVITDEEGFVWRYGARNNCRGGVGQLVGWEPPSFALCVYDPAGEAPFWHEPIDGFLHDDAARANVLELVATMLESYPAPLCATASPWDSPADAITPDVGDMAGALERARQGETAWFAAGADVFGFWRLAESGALTCALFNASPRVSHHMLVPMVGEEVSELVSGYAVPVISADEADALPGVPVAERFAQVFLWPFDSAILHFHARERLARPMEPGLGVLAHITSLPSETGCGTLGAPARAFVDWLAEAGACYWQVLPVSPTDEFGSPYAGISAFAGNTLLLDEGGGEAGERAVAAAPDEYRAFCEREADWLDSYACFMALREHVGNGKAWQEWPEEFRRFDQTVIEGDKELASSVESYRRQQFAFESQWKALRDHAAKRGVKIIGDMPIYVSADSADVWAHPELFQLGSDGKPEVVAGCPPDAFAVEGQIWGNPVYDWGAMCADGYRWWLRRLQRAFDLYDFVRLDHFIGFSRYFSIPVGSKATEGAYRLGPGFPFFRLAREKLGQLPVIAEDLGLLTPRVRALVADCGFLGMDIIQFADGGDPLVSYEPRPEKIVYSGTHDNQTLLGFVRDRYPDEDEDDAAIALIEMVVSSSAPVCIVPLQDLMMLGDEARMNVPGVAEGNWAWQADIAMMLEAFDLISKYTQ